VEARLDAFLAGRGATRTGAHATVTTAGSGFAWLTSDDKVAFISDGRLSLALQGEAEGLLDVEDDGLTGAEARRNPKALPVLCFVSMALLRRAGSGVARAGAPIGGARRARAARSVASRALAAPSRARSTRAREALEPTPKTKTAEERPTAALTRRSAAARAALRLVAAGVLL
jgi:hypothetical protein